MKGLNSTHNAKPLIVLSLLAILILLIYSNTFNAEWHFDDKPNILENKRLQIDNLYPDTLWKTFFAKQQGKLNTLYRPIPSLSFALNWYAGKDSPFGYHLVNITIHILTAFFLYLTISALLQTPNIKHRYKSEDVYFIAVLSATLWAVNPIQTQAVTYIVQRMASMATMFSILAIYLYVKGRLCNVSQRKPLYFAACFFCCTLAIMSKENAVLIIPSLLLVEVIFFQTFDISEQMKNRPLITLGSITVIILLGLLLFKYVFFDFLSRGYTTRSFTLWERLLTQPRVVVYYISQIFYPLPSRLSITHDITLSTSLFSPWTTLPSILAILLGIVVAIYNFGKWPLIAFSVCYFFLNHVIESTVVPLELIFEHRNYLPSLFIFMPVAAGLRYLINYYRSKSRSMAMILVCFITLVITGLGCFTYIRNHTWRTETTLWRDAMLKAPLDARPAWNLAIILAWDKNVMQMQLDGALALFEKALSMNQAREVNDSRILRNIGLIHLHRGELDQAVEAFRRSIRIDPYFEGALFDLVSAFMMMGKWDAASEQLDAILPAAQKGLAPDYYKMKGYILLWQHQPEKALTYLRRALKLEPDNAEVVLNTGVALSWLDKNSNAGFFLRKARNISPKKIRYHYALIENSVRAGEMEEARLYARQMLAQFNVKSIFNGLDKMRNSYRTVPISSEFIIPVVQREIGYILEVMETSTGIDI